MYKIEDKIYFLDSDSVMRIGVIKEIDSFGPVVKSGLQEFCISWDDVWGHFKL